MLHRGPRMAMLKVRVSHRFKSLILSQQLLTHSPFLLNQHSRDHQVRNLISPLLNNMLSNPSHLVINHHHLHQRKIIKRRHPVNTTPVRLQDPFMVAIMRLLRLQLQVLPVSATLVLPPQTRRC
jgi:hypothetical protein